MLNRRALCLLLPSIAVAQDDAVAAIQQRLKTAPVLRGGFEQEKTLSGFAQPLKSQGDYLLLRGKGVIWRTRLPFASQLVVTREAIQQDGGFRLDAQQEPSVRLINALMLAMLDGDIAALQSQFQVQAQLLGQQGWRAQATPKSAALAKLFTRIELEGDTQLRRLRLLEPAGDQISIRFDEQRREPAPSADEAKLLA